jgi:hypothetical protein
MNSTTSRFARLARWQAMLVVAVTVLVIVGGYAFQMHNRFLPGAMPESVMSKESAAPSNDLGGTNAATETREVGDLALYRSVSSRMAAGAPYYATVVERHRLSGYPLRPFVTVRMPTLAFITSTLGLQLSVAILNGLVVLTGFVWWRRLQRITDTASLQPIICLLVVGIGLSTPFTDPDHVVAHEVWAATLMALSWGLLGGFSANPDTGSLTTWLPSILCATAAVLIRETAVPFVLLMGAFAVWRRQWLQVAGWAAVVAVFAGAFALHASYVMAATTSTDLASVGWNSFEGWPFFVVAMHGATGLRILPQWGGVIAVPLVMLGWASWRSDTGAFGFLLFAGYALVFMVLGRPDNWYWGLLISPLFLLGLTFLPQAIVDLVAAIRGTTVSGDRAPATNTQWPTTVTQPATAR